jgi:hypothetical protein
MKKQSLFLPAGFSVSQLKDMSELELSEICNTQKLQIQDVRGLLAIAKTILQVRGDYPTTSIHHDQEFLNRIRTNTLPATGKQLNLNSFQRKPEQIKQSYELAMSLLDDTESPSLDWKQARDLRDKIRTLFQESLFQLGLEIYDQKQKSPSSNPTTSSRAAINKMSESYHAFDNVYLRSYGYAAALAAFGQNVHSVKDMRNELNFILQLLSERKATLEDKIKINKLLRAVKGSYFRNSGTTVDAGTFAALVPVLARQYAATRPKHTLHPGTVLGAEVYEVGVYAGQNYERTNRPRRYGDGLGRT